MSLLTIVKDAMIFCGLSENARGLSNVVSNSDPTVNEFMAFAQQEGDILARVDSWRELKVLGQVTGDGTSTTYDLPADFHRLATGGVFWKDDTPHLPLVMVSSDEMLALKASNSDPLHPVWRLFGSQIEFYPAPANGEIINIEYRTGHWVINSDATIRYLRWNADTDTCLFPERLVVLGTVWRWRQMKGFDYSEQFRTYQMELRSELATQQGRQTISMRSTFADDVHQMGRPAYYRIQV